MWQQLSCKILNLYQAVGICYRSNFFFLQLPFQNWDSSSKMQHLVNHQIWYCLLLGMKIGVNMHCASKNIAISSIMMFDIQKQQCKQFNELIFSTEYMIWISFPFSVLLS